MTVPSDIFTMTMTTGQSGSGPRTTITAQYSNVAAAQVRLTALSPLPFISSYKPENPCAEQSMSTSGWPRLTWQAWVLSE